jgi:hypothetical protein
MFPVKICTKNNGANGTGTPEKCRVIKNIGFHKVVVTLAVRTIEIPEINREMV